jgi:hypothetical protein
MSSPGDEYHFDIPDSILSTVDLHAHWSASASTTTTSTSRPLQHLDVESPSQAGAMEDHLPISTSQASIIEEELVDSVLALMSPSNEPISLDQDENVQDAPPVKDTRTPFQRHRKREFFSVSDLVGPLWCEVQVSGLVTGYPRAMWCGKCLLMEDTSASISMTSEHCFSLLI